MSEDLSIVTKKHDRDYLIDQGTGGKWVRWCAWRKDRPNVRRYGMTEREAIKDLVENVQPMPRTLKG